MSTRRAQIYISGDILRALILIARSQSDEVHKVTAEDVAEGLLNAGITMQYPAVIQHQKAVDKLERDLIKTL